MLHILFYNACEFCVLLLDWVVVDILVLVHRCVDAF